VDPTQSMPSKLLKSLQNITEKVEYLWRTSGDFSISNHDVNYDRNPRLRISMKWRFCYGLDFTPDAGKAVRSQVPFSSWTPSPTDSPAVAPTRHPPPHRWSGRLFHLLGFLFYRYPLN
jgi:hypothetical protein